MICLCLFSFFLCFRNYQQRVDNDYYYSNRIIYEIYSFNELSVILWFSKIQIDAFQRLKIVRLLNIIGNLIKQFIYLCKRIDEQFKIIYFNVFKCISFNWYLNRGITVRRSSIIDFSVSITKTLYRLIIALKCVLFACLLILKRFRSILMVINMK